MTNIKPILVNWKGANFFTVGFGVEVIMILLVLHFPSHTDPAPRFHSETNGTSLYTSAEIIYACIRAAGYITRKLESDANPFSDGPQQAKIVSPLLADGHDLNIYIIASIVLGSFTNVISEQRDHIVEIIKNELLPCLERCIYLWPTASLFHRMLLEKMSIF